MQAQTIPQIGTSTYTITLDTVHRVALEELLAAHADDKLIDGTPRYAGIQAALDKAVAGFRPYTEADLTPPSA